MKSKIKDARFELRLSEKELNLLKDFARKRNKPISLFIRIAIHDYISKNTKHDI